MARALRIDVAGAWHHVMNRGHRGGTLFRDDADRRRFLILVAELPERFGLEVHAFVLMDNHYHLLLRASEANLSDAVRRLHVSYEVKCNWAHRCRGTVFQGRFKSVIIQEEAGAVEVARYIHLNPVRIGDRRSGVGRTRLRSITAGRAEAGRGGTDSGEAAATAGELGGGGEGGGEAQRKCMAGVGEAAPGTGAGMRRCTWQCGMDECGWRRWFGV